MSGADDVDYVARVLAEDSQPVVAVHSDSSKWAAVHDALDPTALRVGESSGTSSLFTVAWVLGITLGLIWVMRNGRTVFEQWQENVHRRANRRRHGIPDDDDRPFNVAYAAAALARRQREEQEKKKMNSNRQHFIKRESEWENHGEAMELRQRLSQQAVSPLVQPAFVQGSSTKPLGNQAAHFVPGDSRTHRTQFRAQPSSDPRTVESYDWSDRYNSNQYMAPAQSSRLDAPQLSVRASSVDATSRRHLDVDSSEPPLSERRKHHQLGDTDDEDRTTKKSRVDGDELIDGDNDPAWDMPGGSRRGSLQVPKRGSKRHANPEEDGDWEMSQDKRARKGSGGRPAQDHEAEDVLDVDMARNSSDAEPERARGIKREREDVDSAVDSPAYDTDESRRPHPARKRRAARKEEPESDAPQSRGQKRERSHERSTTSDEEDDESDAPGTRHKRGRRYDEAEEDSDIVPADASDSEDQPEIAEDPACGGRRVGETWEVNGQSFKVGLDGRRLRHALVRQSRSKFPMPKDSAHSDAKTSVDVIVEKWLNDEEYKAAKENYELAWQDASPATTPDKAERSIKALVAPPSGGKRLLWAGPPPSPIKGARASMGSSSSVQNPFDLAPSNAGRRIASAHLLRNNPAESPKLRSAKSFSKWEKQDLEASSLKKMRARMEKEKAAEEAAKPPPPPAPTPLTSSTNTQSQPAPSIQFNLDAKKPPPASATPAPNPFAKPASSTPSTQTPSFSFAKPDNTPSSAPPAPAAQPPSASPFPTQNPTPSPAPPVPVASKPSFSFGPAATSGPPASEANRPAAAKPSFSFGPSAPTPSASTPTAPKPSFSFGPPSAEPSKVGAQKPSFSFGPAAGSTPASEPSKGAMSNPFAKPAPQPTSAPAPAPAPAGNSPFAFNPTSQPAQAAPPRASSFQFNTSGAQANPATQPGVGPSSGSLLNRMGSGQGASNIPQAPAPQTSWPGPSSGGPFSDNSPANQSSSGSPFAQNQPQPQNANNQFNAFKQPSQSQNQSQSFNKPTSFGPAASFSAEAPKSPFGPPSSTPVASAFSFSKPADSASKPVTPSLSFGKPAGQPEAPTTQSKPSFSFSFGAGTTPGNAGASTASPNPSPFNPAPASSTGAQPTPGGLFNFGSSSGAPSNQNPFGFGNKPAEGEKK